MSAAASCFAERKTMKNVTGSRSDIVISQYDTHENHTSRNDVQLAPALVLISQAGETGERLIKVGVKACLGNYRAWIPEPAND
jgi:hypothetical protein